MKGEALAFVVAALVVSQIQVLPGGEGEKPLSQVAERVVAMVAERALETGEQFVEVVARPTPEFKDLIADDGESVGGQSRGLNKLQKKVPRTVELVFREKGLSFNRVESEALISGLQVSLATVLDISSQRTHLFLLIPWPGDVGQLPTSHLPQSHGGGRSALFERAGVGYPKLSKKHQGRSQARSGSGLDPG